jgi:prefoldin subunit 5
MANENEMNALKQEIAALRARIGQLEGRINDISNSMPKRLAELEKMIKNAKGPR